jgi:hypothetical protein
MFYTTGEEKGRGRIRSTAADLLVFRELSNGASAPGRPAAVTAPRATLPGRAGIMPLCGPFPLWSSERRR